VQPSPTYLAPVPQGPRAYRRKIRTAGPLLGLLPPAALGALSFYLLHDNTSTARGVLGFLTAILSAPGLLVAGAPLATGSAPYTLAVVGSAVVWLAVSVAATKRATRTPVATWGDYWKEYLWLGGGLWLGVIGALVAANLILGGAFL